ncbi:MAG: cytotoxic translational repressor of toxin-antitoxin stability system [Opitutaceae bacterium]|jgi:mRNA interferase RelE/StbE|nr:cytotoxic translational repressor of toxin-antitoxin stability system [Opitutaceae bacterium]
MSKRPGYALELHPQVKAFYETLGPERRMIKRALEGLRTEKGNIRALESPLAGYYRLSIGGYRLIFHYAPGRKIVCVFLNTRKLVYDLFENEVLRCLLGKLSGQND